MRHRAPTRPVLRRPVVRTALLCSAGAVAAAAALSGAVAVPSGGSAQAVPAAFSVPTSARVHAGELADVTMARRSAGEHRGEVAALSHRVGLVRSAVAAAAREQAEQVRARAERVSRDRERLRLAVRDPQSAARVLAARRGWGQTQFSCLDLLWSKESQWQTSADNPTSSAYGIPQALPGVRMATSGKDWRTNPLTQIRWGLQYIESAYGTPCAAWAHSRATNWY
ncbi:MAG: hypothetical protein H7231_06080 [Rhodoferax sp.]|nr:hypothetical protein [Actinomycetota bacterium]